MLVGDWELVEDAEVGTYFRHTKTNEARWTLPIDALQELKQEISAAEDNQCEYSPKQTLVEDDDGLALNKDDEDIVSRWSLRASSLVYDDESLRGSVLSTANEDDNRGLNQFNAVADGGIFTRPSCVQAIRSLQAWLRAHASSLDPRAQVSSLRFPMFRCSSSPLSDPVVVVIRAPGPAAIFQLTASEATAVFSLITEALTVLHPGTRIDTPVHHSFVLKVTGRNDYLADDSRALGEYAYVHACARNKAVARLTLLSLSDDDTARKVDAVQDQNRPRPVISFATEALPVASDTIDAAAVAWPFRVKIHRLEHLAPDYRVGHIIVTAGLWAGPTIRLGTAESFISPPAHDGLELLETTAAPATGSDVVQWRGPAWLTSKAVTYRSIPSFVRLGFVVYGVENEASARRLPLAAGWMPLVDATTGCFLAGHHTLSLWPCSMAPASFDHGNFPLGFPTTPNPKGHHSVLAFELDAFEAPLRVVYTYSDRAMPAYTGPPEPATQSTLAQLERADVLHSLSQHEKAVLWGARCHCINFPALLPIFLRAINWSCPDAVTEVRRLVPQWARADNVAWLIELLGHDVPDPVIRAWVVYQLDALPDDALADYLLQLVQVLKYELYMDCAVARFILHRSLRNPAEIGQRAFWLIKTEADDWLHAERYSVLLATYVSLHVAHRALLFEQSRLVDQLELIAQRVKRADKADRTGCLHYELQLLNASLPKDRPFHLCLSLRFECVAVRIDACQVMGSAKKPLWLSFENADPLGEPIAIIFKHGDDLRQDLLSLQLLRLMDKLWSRHGLDLRLNAYGCQSIGFQEGMIEVVPNSKTTAHIHRDYGHVYFGAWMATPIESFLKDSTGDAVDNFIRTCAGYCVATYVLGIGDRHSDNIMVARSGHLFHIDFGHFLGNFKVKFGIKRERAPFVLTPEMAFVMRANTTEGRFDTFESYCCDAYNLLRQHPAHWVALFALMVPAQVPEMTAFIDITYVRDQLSLDLSDAAAAAKFRAEIKSALASTSRRVDNWLHNMKHGIDFFAS
ncbi:phosphatidylinositol-4,5-diphosphate 3-kinase [Achlya hypogyna]|uniref:Phosphatidylinositol-4,5-diphosphate 3-kinase n=1 Tax=Achlya hypogyna TaxID=1202772 RepID=A0A1V9YPG4_ACHHY|nr:phosphatidylinositol-4,5-diphosphate 3-kinase [Achlya hypogyna]